MTSKELRQSLRSGDPLFGTLIVSPSPRWPAMVAGCGLDFVFIDTEHIALDRSQLSWMCQTYSAMGLPPLVRIPSPDPYQACMALDGGAAGVIAPYVESVDEVLALRGAIKLRPLKGERLAAMLDDSTSVEPGVRHYWQKHNTDKLFIINIESKPALERLDELLAKAQYRQKQRRPSKPTRSSVRKRLDSKAQHGKKKTERKRILED